MISIICRDNITFSVYGGYFNHIDFFMKNLKNNQVVLSEDVNPKHVETLIDILYSCEGEVSEEFFDVVSRKILSITNRELLEIRDVRDYNNVDKKELYENTLNQHYPELSYLIELIMTCNHLEFISFRDYLSKILVKKLENMTLIQRRKWFGISDKNLIICDTARTTGNMALITDNNIDPDIARGIMNEWYRWLY